MTQNFQLGTFGQYVSANATANSVTFSSNSLSLSTNVFTIGTGSYFVSNGNVGIGTSSPSYQLDVSSGSAQFPVGIRILASTHATSRRSALLLDTWYLLQDTNANGTRDFGIYDSNIPAFRLYIKTDGNVGIGTTSPSEKLDVNGNIKINNGSADGGQLILASSGYNDWYTDNYNGSFRFINGATERLRIQSDGTLKVTTGVWHQTLDGKNRFYFSSDSRTYFGSYNGYEWRSSGDSNIMTLSNSGYLGVNYSADTNYRLLVRDAVSGLHGAWIYNASTNGSAYARLLISTDVSNLYGLFDIVNNSGNPYGVVSTGSGANYFYFTCGSNGLYVAKDSTSWTANSDERLKDIIEPITNGLEKVYSLRSVIGKYKTDDVDKRRSMIIAQDVQKVLPEVVTIDRNGYLGVSYTELIPLLISAIKEEKTIVETLSDRITNLENIISELAK